MKIKSLKLYSGNLEAQRRFYSETLNLPLIKETSASLQFKIGESILEFEKCKGQPYYHFAINIASNQLAETAEWIKNKVQLLKWQGEEVVNFPNWNAKGIYFYDKDRNIVELIARKDLNIHLSNSFSEKSLLQLSEIGVSTTDVSAVAERLKKNYRIETYDEDLSRFHAAGSETGLFIIVNSKVKKWIPAMDEAKPFPFEVSIVNRLGKQHHLQWQLLDNELHENEL